MLDTKLLDEVRETWQLYQASASLLGHAHTPQLGIYWAAVDDLRRHVVGGAAQQAAGGGTIEPLTPRQPSDHPVGKETS